MLSPSQQLLSERLRTARSSAQQPNRSKSPPPRNIASHPANLMRQRKRGSTSPPPSRDNFRNQAEEQQRQPAQNSGIRVSPVVAPVNGTTPSIPTGARTPPQVFSMANSDLRPSSAASSAAPGPIPRQAQAMQPANLFATPANRNAPDAYKLTPPATTSSDYSPRPFKLENSPPQQQQRQPQQSFAGYKDIDNSNLAATPVSNVVMNRMLKTATGENPGGFHTANASNMSPQRPKLSTMYDEQLQLQQQQQQIAAQRAAAHQFFQPPPCEVVVTDAPPLTPHGAGGDLGLSSPTQQKPMVRLQEQYKKLSNLYLRSEQLHLHSRKLREKVMEEAATARAGKADMDGVFALAVVSHSRRQYDAAISAYGRVIKADKYNVAALALCAVAIVMREAAFFGANGIPLDVSDGLSFLMAKARPSRERMLEDLRAMLQGSLPLPSFASYDRGENWSQDGLLAERLRQTVSLSGEVDSKAGGGVDLSSAASLLDKALSLGAFHADVLWAAGLYHAYRGRIPLAEAFWALSLEVCSNHVGVLHAQARLQFMQGDLQAAQISYGLALKAIKQTGGGAEVAQSFLESQIPASGISAEEGGLRLRFAGKSVLVSGVYGSKDGRSSLNARAVSIVGFDGKGSEMGASALVERSGVLCGWGVLRKMLSTDTKAGMAQAEDALAWALTLVSTDKAALTTLGFVRGAISLELWSAMAEECCVTVLPRFPEAIAAAQQQEFQNARPRSPPRSSMDMHNPQVHGVEQATSPMPRIDSPKQSFAPSQPIPSSSFQTAASTANKGGKKKKGKKDDTPQYIL